MRLSGSYNKNIYHYRVIKYEDYMKKILIDDFFCLTSKDVQKWTNISASSIKKMTKGELVFKYLNYEIMKVNERNPIC
tara:strand:- start:282 stop:515 length:234 start_codon:yes stop_codon:yes gene_type:complete